MIDLDQLSHAVQYRHADLNVARWWETIAAFNVKSVADKYADDCRHGGEGVFEYRVIETQNSAYWRDQVEDAYEKGYTEGHNEGVADGKGY